MPDGASRLDETGSGLKAALAAITGPDGVTDDAAARRLHSGDVWSESAEPVTLIVAPDNLDQLSRVMKLLHERKVPVAPRGAGMSYTSGYIPTVSGTVSLDMRRMNRIIDLRPDDMVVTVEAGCTWIDLNKALEPHGLRTPFFGPMSGLISTIGGGISQLNAMLGAGHHGTSSESVVAMTMVLGDGSILRTGARGEDGESPFYRHFGPDLTGLFCGDCGAFGVKAHITLRLIQTPKYEDYASFEFSTGGDLMRAMAALARAGVAAEMCAFDPGLTRVRMQRASMTSDVKALGAVVTRQKNPLRGLWEAVRVAKAGRSFISLDSFPLHLNAEGRSAEGVAHDMATARRIAAAHNGQEVANTIAKVIRALPFPPLNSALGPAGERWIPIHGQIALSKAPALYAALEEVFAGLAEQFAKHDIKTGYLFTSMSTNALILEPVIYWPEKRLPVHHQALEPVHMARLPEHADNPEATAVVVVARKRLIATFKRFGCSHFQVGRSYPYRESRDEASRTLLDALKDAVDPARLLNPGVLGFTKDAK
ncbi:FAD-binding oxidoreductase [Niveispirillum sp. KHB5.9]|uniref:FAD-binding oxidoreductase n=1 Tax=Niveispirillum sp. KHB5.9 TaxID=3400269 RepID=UPI003A8B0960